MRLDDDQLLFIAMCLIPVEDNLTLQNIRERFMKRDRPWSDVDAKAEYRYREARAIMERWQSSKG